MPPKGRKKIATEAKSNGVGEIAPTIKVMHAPRMHLATFVHRGRPRKAAAIEEAMEVDPKLDGEAAKGNSTTKEVAPEENINDAEENVKLDIPEKKPSAAAKRGKKVESEISAEEVESKDSNKDLLAEPASELEIKPEVKAPAKRGRKKAADQLPKEEVKESEEVAEEEQEKVPAKRGRKKAADQSSEIKKERTDAESTEIETEAKAEPEKVAAKRGRKKAEEPEPSKDDEQEETEEVTSKAGPSKRQRKVEEKPEDKDEDDFAPRKTRGARNVKEVAAAPVGRGRKRKGNEDQPEEKENLKKKGKAVEVAENQLRKLTVNIKRDAELDERAKNTSKEEEEPTSEEEEEGEKVMANKGKATSGRKRVNKDEEDAKPSKVKKDAPEKKSGSKKDQIPDVTTMDFGNDSKTPDGKPWNFKITSWNISGVRAWLEKNGLSYLHHEKPDILCLQETKCSKDKLPAELQKIEGYHCHWLEGEKEGYSGVALLSKEEPISIKDGIGIEEHDNEGRVITAEYEKFFLVTSYVPNAGRGLPRLDYRQKWDKDFREYLKELDKTKPVILCGDLNVAHKEIDLANPKGNKKNAGFTQEERDGFTTLLKEGFVDTFRHLYPDTKAAYTFWTYMMNARAKNVGWRLDYFVVSERFVDHLCDNVIRKDVMGSDHCPIGLFLHV